MIFPRRALLATTVAIFSALFSEHLSAQSLYVLDGEPSGIEEEIRWHLNRGRFDSVSENARQGTAYSDVPAASGPVAPHQNITIAARRHSEDMAKTGLFQHETVPDSAYYDPETQPSPFDRMSAEGYDWNQAAENIAAGYPGAKEVFAAWWNSQGHRTGMFDPDLREIGNGYFFWSASVYRHFYTMDLGSSGNTHFFTDTIFHDSNGDSAFTAIEALSGIAVTLVANGSVHSSYDISSSVGSFAIPIQLITSDAVVQVVISNGTAGPVSLSLPRNANGFETLAIMSGEAKVYGAFTKTSQVRNVGFRDVAPAQNDEAPTLSIARTVEGIVIEWASDESLEYLPESSADFLSWQPLLPNFVAGTQETMRYVEAPGSQNKFYRVQVRGR